MNSLALFLSLISPISNVGSRSSSSHDFRYYRELLPAIVGALNNEKNFGTFSTSQVEYSRIIDGCDGHDWFYFDFVGDAGFVLINDVGQLGIAESRFDLAVLREAQGVVFDGRDLWVGEAPYLYENEFHERDIIIGSPGSIAQQYDGFIEYDGLYAILSTKYGSLGGSWVTGDSGKLHGLSSGCSYEGYGQGEDSVYLTAAGGSEGNCGLTSTSNALAYYSRHGGYTDLPNYDDMVNITPAVDEPALVAAAASHTPYAYYPAATTVSIHEIYAAERAYAVALGYVCGGMGDTETSAAFVGAASDYGYLGTFQAYFSYTFAFLKQEIDSNHPVQLRTQGDVKYDAHGMMITGYQTYTLSKWVNVRPGISIYVEYFLPFVSVFDGSDASGERWFDLTCLSNCGAAYDRSDVQSIATLHLEEMPE